MTTSSWQIAAALAVLALGPGLPVGAAPAAPPAGSVSETSNISGGEYPRILPDLRVVFRVKAPDAQKVEFDLGKRYLAVKDPDRHDRSAGARLSLLLSGDLRRLGQ